MSRSTSDDLFIANQSIWLINLPYLVGLRTAGSSTKVDKHHVVGLVHHFQHFQDQTRFSAILLRSGDYA